MTLHSSQMAPSMRMKAGAPETEVRDRFLNPFLAHRLSDIASNHAEKKERRLRPVVARGRALATPVPQPILTAILETRHA